MTSAQALPQHTGMSPRTRRLVWAATIVIAFVIGYLLGRRACVKELASGGGGNTRVVAQGGPSESARSHVKLGTGEGSASSSGGRTNNIDGGVDSAKGDGAAGGGGDEDAGSGGGNGDIPGGSGVFKKIPVENDSLFGHFVARLTKDDQSTGQYTSDSTPDPGVVTRVAHDFSLDGTGLPRYPNATRVVSSLATRRDVPADSGTACGIETRDSYDSVVAWYHQRVPAGWQAVNLGAMERVAKQLSPDNIGKMLMSAVNGDTAAVADTSAPASAGTSVAIWTAPAGDAGGKRSVMVTARPGATTEIVMTRAVRP
jgi:hypothetical protein